MTTATRLKQLRDNGIIVRLTPDDILTLKLLRDCERRQWMETRTFKRRDTSSEHLIETLERILKQV